MRRVTITVEQRAGGWVAGVDAYSPVLGYFRGMTAIETSMPEALRTAERMLSDWTSGCEAPWG